MRSIIVFFFLFFYGCVFAQDKVNFHPEGGNHLGLKKVEVEIPKGWSVYYTRDGTLPNKNAEKVNKFISINGDEALYFAIYKRNKNTPIYKSNTYITSRKQTLPYFSILTDPNHLFDSLEGIYEKGCCASEKPPFKGANFWKDIEHPIHIEFMDRKMNVINQKAGIKIFGGYSKSMPQKSFAIYARKKYGTNRFHYPLFSQLPFNKYKNFILRNAGGDMQGAHIRDPFSSQLTKKWGIAFQEYRPVAVYINGDYWGIYSLREKINEHFIHNHFGIKKKNISVISPPNKIKYDTRNTLKDYQSLINYIKSKPTLDNKAIEEVQKMIDIHDYLKYSIIQIYLGNSDASGNIRFYKDVKKNTPYKTILYDLDMGLSIFDRKKVKENSFELFTSSLDTNKQYPPEYTLILRKLLTNDSIRSTFITYFIDALNTFFQPQTANKLLDQMVYEWKDEIGYHRKRWNVKELRYDRSIQRIRYFLSKRPLFIRRYLKEYFDLKDQFLLKIIDKKGGSIHLNSVILSSDYKANYYKENPICFQAIPNENYEFVGWKNQKDQNRKQCISVQEDQLTIEPIFKAKKKPDYYNQLIVSEFKVIHSKNSSVDDWIEILNTSKDTIDLSDWILKDNQDQHSFTLDKGTLLLPKSYLILTTNKKAFNKEYGMFMNVKGDIPFGFNANDKIRLYNDKGYLMINMDLSALKRGINREQSWVRQSLLPAKNKQQQWRQAEPTPGDNSVLLSTQTKLKKANSLLHTIVFYGVILLLLIFIIIFYYFGNRIES